MHRRLPEHMADNGTFTFALAARERSDCPCLDAMKLSEAPGVALRVGDQGGSGVPKGGVKRRGAVGFDGCRSTTASNNQVFRHCEPTQY